jgi:hypothetical protein
MMTFRALVVFHDGHAEFFNEKFKVGIHVSAPYAIGAGRDIARGAMAMGADAKLAVKICCELDTACGGEIQVVRLEQLKKAVRVEASRLPTTRDIIDEAHQMDEHNQEAKI